MELQRIQANKNKKDSHRTPCTVNMGRTVKAHTGFPVSVAADYQLRKEEKNTSYKRKFTPEINPIAEASNFTNSDKTLTNRSASGERVSSVAWRAATNWIVVDHFASRSNAAGPRARVSAFLIAAGFVPTAVGVHYTFRSASGRAADVSRNARADGLSVHHSALAVRAARRRITRFRIQRC